MQWSWNPGLPRPANVAATSIFSLVMTLLFLGLKVTLVQERLGELIVQHRAAVLVNGWFWQPLTAIFAHPTMEHFLLNLALTVLMGCIVEPVSQRGFVISFLGGGITGNLVSLAFVSFGDTAGASGGTLSVVGYYLATSSREYFSGKRKTVSGFMLAYLCILIVSFLSPGTNIVAHVTGGTFGLLLGCCSSSALRRLKRRFAVKVAVCSSITVNEMFDVRKAGDANGHGSVGIKYQFMSLQNPLTRSLQLPRHQQRRSTTLLV